MFYDVGPLWVPLPLVILRISSKVPVLASPLARPPSRISGVKVHPLIHTFNKVPTTAKIRGINLFGIKEILCLIMYPRHKHMANTTTTTYRDKNSIPFTPFLHHLDPSLVQLTSSNITYVVQSQEMQERIVIIYFLIIILSTQSENKDIKYQALFFLVLACF